MAVPRKRTPQRKRNSRRSHHAKDPVNAIICVNCKASHLPHRVCLSCGYYNGREVLKLKSAAKA